MFGIQYFTRFKLVPPFPTRRTHLNNALTLNTYFFCPGIKIAYVILYLYKFFFSNIMKNVKTKVKSRDPKNWILPENTFSQDEFLAGIRKAENGPFYTIQESMEHFEQWIKSRAKR